MTQRLITALVLASISALSTAVDLEKNKKAVGSDLVDTGFATTFGDLGMIQSSELQLAQSTNFDGRWSACENGKCNFDYVFWCDIIAEGTWLFAPDPFTGAWNLANSFLALYDENPINIPLWWWGTLTLNALDKEEFLKLWFYFLSRAGGVYCDEDFQNAWNAITYSPTYWPWTLPAFNGTVNNGNFPGWIYDQCYCNPRLFAAGRADQTSGPSTYVLPDKIRLELEAIAEAPH